MDTTLAERINQIEATHPDVLSPKLDELFEMLQQFANRQEDVSFLVTRYGRNASPGMLNVLSFVLADKTELVDSHVLSLCLDILEDNLREMFGSTLGNFFVLLRNVAEQTVSIPRDVDWARVGRIIRCAVEHPKSGMEGILAVRDAFWVLQALREQGLLDKCLPSTDLEWIRNRAKGDPFFEHEFIAHEIQRLEGLLRDGV